MKRLAELVLATALLLAPASLLDSGAGAGATMLANTTVATSDQTAASFTQVATCFENVRRLDVLALMDTSGSLKHTDKNAERVGALIGMLNILGKYGTDSVGEANRMIDVQLAGFDTNFQPGRWQNLSATTAQSLVSEAKQFKTRYQGQDTDFANALIGAQSQFAAKDATTTGAPACRLLVLFTDGQYDLATSVARQYAAGVPGDQRARIMSQGEHYVCAANGLADQLRAANTPIFAIGLVSGQSQNQSFLQSVAERVAGPTRCGTSTASPGVYFPVDNVDTLLTTFGTAIARAVGPGTPDGPSNALSPCTTSDPTDQRCTQRFTLDESLSQFELLLNLGSSQIAVQLTSPTGESVRLDANRGGNYTLGGAQLSVSPLTRTDLEVDGTLPPPDSSAGPPPWAGTWTVRFTDTTGQNADTVTNSQLIVFGALIPVITPKPTGVVAGQPHHFTIRITNATGSPRTPSDFVGSVTVSATATDPQGHGTGIPVGTVNPDGSYSADYTVPANDTASYVDIDVRLDVTTRTGLRLQPRVTRYPVVITQPAAYPSIHPTSLVLSQIVGKGGTATGALTVTAGTGAGECVRLAAGIDDAPTGSGAVTTRLTSNGAAVAGRCVAVHQGTPARIDVSAQPQRLRSGVVIGRIVATLTTAGAPDRAVVVPMRFQTQVSIDTGKRWELFIPIALGGIGLPLLFLWLWNWRSARFDRPRQLRQMEREILVDQTRILDVQTGGDLTTAVLGTTFGAMPTAPDKLCREFSHGRLTFRGRAPWLPWRQPYGEVWSTGSAVLTARGGHGVRSGRITLELNQTWVFVLDEVTDAEADQFRGHLYLFVTDGNIPNKSRQLVADVESSLPHRVRTEALHLKATAATTVDAETSQPNEDVFHPPV